MKLPSWFSSEFASLVQRLTQQHSSVQWNDMEPQLNKLFVKNKNATKIRDLPGEAVMTIANMLPLKDAKSFIESGKHIRGKTSLTNTKNYKEFTTIVDELVKLARQIGHEANIGLSLDDPIEKTYPDIKICNNKWEKEAIWKAGLQQLKQMYKDCEPRISKSVSYVPQPAGNIKYTELNKQNLAQLLWYEFNIEIIKTMNDKRELYEGESNFAFALSQMQDKGDFALWKEIKGDALKQAVIGLWKKNIELLPTGSTKILDVTAIPEMFVKDPKYSALISDYLQKENRYTSKYDTRSLKMQKQLQLWKAMT